jgi:hypothetical protein
MTSCPVCDGRCGDAPNFARLERQQDRRMRESLGFWGWVLEILFAVVIGWW